MSYRQECPLVMVDEDRVPDLDHKLAELVAVYPPTRTVGGWKVDLRSVETGEVWYFVWASCCKPLTKLAREMLAGAIEREERRARRMASR